MVDDTSLCVPARPAGSQGHLISPQAADSQVSPVARAIANYQFDFPTCLSLLEESFSSQAAIALKDPAVTRSDAYFNLGAFGFEDGRRCGVFQRTEQFSEIARFLNAFLRLQFPSASWTSVCVSHNVRTQLHTDAGNEVASFNHSISLGNFSGGEIWITPALHSSAMLVPPPEGSESEMHKAGAKTLGEQVDTFESGVSFPCSSLHCTSPWHGDRWVLTAYTCKGSASLPADVRAHLRSLGFPLPGDEPSGALPQPTPTPTTASLSPGFFLDICCGATAPLSVAMGKAGIQHICVDALGEEPLDLLCDKTYDSLMRLCFSGVVVMAHAAPPCKEYSRLKLRPGGPKAIRSPSFLNGLPDNTAEQQARVTQSQRILYRCVCLLRAVFASGGHASLEQPTNAMSWLEPFVQDFLSETQAHLSDIPACTVGLPLAKSWLFASSFSQFSCLAGKCLHPQGHESVAGKLDAQGSFLSQRTAEYPAALAERYAAIAAPLFGRFSSHTARTPCSLSFALACTEVKPRGTPPFGSQDGGGIYSLPDWSYGPRYAEDQLGPLRTEWRSWLLEKHLPARLVQHIASGKNEPLFTNEETTWLQSSFKRFSDGLSGAPDWDFSVAEGQPYCLSALQRLSTILADKDTSLFPALLQGVPTGFDDDIPRSHTLRPRRQGDADEGHELLVCEGNWQGAESDPALLQELLEEELTAGFLEEVVSIEEAYKRWGKDRVAVGRVNIVKAPGRSPRLVVDNSICNTNQNCNVPEQFSLPCLQDIQASYPLREDNEPISGFSLDVKGAHKTSRVREQDRGLLGLRQQERLFFYKVCPFGATFSSHWFARLGGFFTRCLHLLIWLPHVLMLYVDDLLLYQNAKVLPLSACLTLAFCSCFHIPLSWKKLQMGPVITWIGWQLNLGTACYTLPDEKRNKLQSQVRECLSHRLVSKKQLDKLLGLLQWILHGFPALRPWLCTLYDDMHRPLGTNVSISPTTWPGIAAHLNDKMVFTSCPAGTSIRPGSTLLSARHVELRCLPDLPKVPVSSKRIWMRVADPSSSRRKLSIASRETLEFFLYLSSGEWRPRPLRPAPLAQVASAADAFGKGNDCGVGGWLRMQDGTTSWFSHRYTVSDFTSLGLPMQANANLDISSYETLAQCFILICFWKLSGSGRLALTLPALSDNTGAESVCNRLYTSKVPLNLFVRKLSMWSSVTGVQLDCSHISGEKNDDADLLSRWDGQSELPERFLPENRVHISLSDFWHIRFAVTLHPPDAFLKWQLPEPHQLGPSNRVSKERR